MLFMEKIKAKYGLFTALSLMVGTVVGSGIFFKSDEILIATGGSIGKGVLVFCLAAISIIFGSLTIAQIAHHTQGTGGIISYAEHVCRPQTACVFGWILAFFYFPILIPVIGWVSTTYLGMLFGYEFSINQRLILTLLLMTFFYLMNAISYKAGGMFQNLATIIKLIPLLFICLVGFILGDPSTILESSNYTNAVSSTSWLLAIPSVAFAFDGWVVSVSISHEIKNSQRNLPIALTLGSLIILLVYVLYFVGVSILIGPAEIMALGDEHIGMAATKFLGENGTKIIILFVVISVLGTFNGMIIGGSRMPYNLASHQMIPAYQKVARIHPKFNISISSVWISYIIAVIWLFLHYLTQKYPALAGNDLSEIVVVTTYILYLILYVKVILLTKKNHIKMKNKIWQGYCVPILAIIGASFILIIGMQNPFFWIDNLYAILLVILALYSYHSIQKSNLSINHK